MAAAGAAPKNAASVEARPRPRKHHPDEHQASPDCLVGRVSASESVREETGRLTAEAMAVQGAECPL